MLLHVRERGRQGLPLDRRAEDHARDLRADQVGDVAGEADRQPARGIHLAEQHAGDGLAAARARIPGLQHRRDAARRNIETLMAAGHLAWSRDG